MFYQNAVYFQPLLIAVTFSNFQRIKKIFLFHQTDYINLNLNYLVMLKNLPWNV